MQLAFAAQAAVIRIALFKEVCLDHAACLNEDAEGGRDHYCRRSWARVEAVVCSRHKISLEINCGRCFGIGLFKFRSTLTGTVGLFCGDCMRLSRRRDQTDLRQVASFMGEGGSEFERIETASCFLPLVARQGGMPYIAALGFS